MYNFCYHRPANLDEAAQIISESEDAMLLAGGQTLLPALKQRLNNPTDLVDLAAISGLYGITLQSDRVTIGAMTRHADVARSAEVNKTIPALADLAGRIGDPQVRNRGTIGGSIANNDPAADYPAALLALAATIHTNQRTIAADDFFTDMFETALQSSEIITAIDFPIPAKAAYMKFPNPASRYAIVGVFVAKRGEDVRVAVTGAATSVFRAKEMEHALSAHFNADALQDITTPVADMNSDIHASAEYRAHLVTIMAKRAVAAANAV